MGQHIASVSFSCVDCGSRQVTLEDYDQSHKLKSLEFRLSEIIDDMNDEVTVFESPIKANKRQCNPHAFIFQHLDTYNEALAITSPNTQVNETKPSFHFQIKKVTFCAKGEENVEPRLHTPIPENFSLLKSRRKAFSSNFSPVSMNLVDSIRKLSNFSSETTLEGTKEC